MHSLVRLVKDASTLARTALAAVVVVLGVLTDAVDRVLGGDPHRVGAAGGRDRVSALSGHDGLPVGAAFIITAVVFAYLAREQGRECTPASREARHPGRRCREVPR